MAATRRCGATFRISGIGLLGSAHLLAAAGGDGRLEIDANPNPLRTLACGVAANVQEAKALDSRQYAPAPSAYAVPMHSSQRKEDPMFKTLKWEDWTGMALGAALLASPWALGYAQDSSAATMNALFVGSILVLEEALEAEQREPAEEWIDVAVGLWLLASPAVLGFASVPAAALSALAVGAFTIVFAGLAMTTFDQKLERWWHDHVTHA